MSALHFPNFEIAPFNQAQFRSQQYSGQNGVLGRIHVLLRRYHRA